MCRRALIVEDEILVALDIECVLGECGIEVIGNGVEGTMGVMTKPFSCAGLSATIDYIATRDAGV